MSIKTEAPPQESLDILASSLRKLAPASLGRMPRAASLEVEPLESRISHPHRVYLLRLDDLASGKGLASARPVSWRYLIMEGGQAVASAEVNHDEQGGRHQFAHLNQGVFNAGTLEAIQAAEADPGLAAGSYELRMLRIPALYVVALWLKDTHARKSSIAHENDVLIPIAPTSPLLTAGKPYSPAEMLDTLRESARQKREFDSSPRA